MPLDLNQSTSVPTISRPTAAGAGSAAETAKLGPVIDRSGSSSTSSAESERGGTSDARAGRDVHGNVPIDGIRIFNPLPPMERSRLYHHEVSSRLDVLQAWEGVVTEIDHSKEQFTARLYDLTNVDAEESEAVFDLAEVGRNDRDLLKLGGVFRWMIGYRRHNYGQQERVSAIVFRRLPTWYQSDLDEAVEYGERLASAISIDSELRESPGS